MSEEGKLLAVVDLGTNTFNLLIVLVDEQNGWQEVFRNSIPVKLARGGISKRTISKDRLFRGLDAMISYKSTMENFGCTDVIAFATSAVREADNGVEFIALIQERTGIAVTIIDGDVEAELIHLGVHESLPEIQEPLLMIDIGGGSTEFIISRTGEVLWKASFPLGVSRIAEIANLPDPLGKSGVSELEEILDNSLSPLISAMEEVKPEILVGASGSFNTFADMLQPMNGLIPLEANGATEFDIAAFADLCQRLIQLEFNQRLKMPGMHPVRADTLQLSAVLVQYVLKKFSIKRLLRSKFALKEGAIVRELKLRME